MFDAEPFPCAAKALLDFVNHKEDSMLPAYGVQLLHIPFWRHYEAGIPGNRFHNHRSDFIGWQIVMHGPTEVVQTLQAATLRRTAEVTAIAVRVVDVMYLRQKRTDATAHVKAKRG